MMAGDMATICHSRDLFSGFFNIYIEIPALFDGLLCPVYPDLLHDLKKVPGEGKNFSHHLQNVAQDHLTVASKKYCPVDLEKLKPGFGHCCFLTLTCNLICYSRNSMFMQHAIGAHGRMEW
jgi:hypothetical protein